MEWLVFAGILFLSVLAVLYRNQGRMIYGRRAYTADELPPGHAYTTLHFQTPQGPQLAYFLRARNRAPVSRNSLWIFFGGNETLALDWFNFARELPDPSASFLFVEYPGFGSNPGSTSPQGIRENIRGAMGALQDHLRMTGDGIATVHVMGHSLGAASALMFAMEYRTHRLLLLAPFTTMLEMARLRVGVPLCYLLSHRFDNVTAMQKIVSEDMFTQCTIIHGDADEVIPVEMARRLAAPYPARIEYREIPAGTHASILHDNREELYTLMGA